MDANLLLPLLSFLSNTPGQPGPTANTTNGPVVGTLIEVPEPKGTTIRAFQGIPYAKPPNGTLRFQKPENPANWTTPRNATQYSKACLQFDKRISQNETSEDCLYLNVYTPNPAPSSPLPVMVWIHGGAFVVGTAAQYPGSLIGQNFVSRDVVVVSINYRLGVFGFLNAGSAIPGNWGLWDQVKALEWVQANIHYFGGDPNQVTIFGESAGAASVSFLNYSPLVTSKNLYIRSISESGSGHCPWALAHYPGEFNSSRDLAIAADCTTMKAWNSGDLSELAACLQKKDARLLLNLSRPMEFWVPTIDGAGGLLPNNLTYLGKHRNPNISTIIGTNHDESAPITKLLAGVLTFANFTKAELQATIKEFTPEAVIGGDTAAVRAALFVAYARGISPDPNVHLPWLNATTEFQTDYFFVWPAVKEIENQLALNATTYVYRFDYYSPTFPWPTGYKGIFHAMELDFVFPRLFQIAYHYPSKQNWTWDSNDIAVSNQFGIAWTNFAKTGDPNKPTPLSAKWSPANQDRQFYSINLQSQMQPAYGQSAAEVWGDLIGAITGNRSGPPHPPQPPSSPSGYSYGYVVGTWLLLSLVVLCVMVILFGVLKYARD